MDLLFELGELVGVRFHLPKEVGGFGLQVGDATLDGSHLPFVLTLGDSLLQLQQGLIPGRKPSFPVESGEVSFEIADAAFQITELRLLIE